MKVENDPEFNRSLAAFDAPILKYYRFGSRSVRTTLNQPLTPAALAAARGAVPDARGAAADGRSPSGGASPVRSRQSGREIGGMRSAGIAPAADMPSAAKMFPLLGSALTEASEVSMMPIWRAPSDNSLNDFRGLEVPLPAGVAAVPRQMPRAADLRTLAARAAADERMGVQASADQAAAAPMPGFAMYPPAPSEASALGRRMPYPPSAPLLAEQGQGSIPMPPVAAGAPQEALMSQPIGSRPLPQTEAAAQLVASPQIGVQPAALDPQSGLPPSAAPMPAPIYPPMMPAPMAGVPYGYMYPPIGGVPGLWPPFMMHPGMMPPPGYPGGPFAPPGYQGMPFPGQFYPPGYPVPPGAGGPAAPAQTNQPQAAPEMPPSVTSAETMSPAAGAPDLRAAHAQDQASDGAARGPRRVRSARTKLLRRERATPLRLDPTPDRLARRAAVAASLQDLMHQEALLRRPENGASDGATQPAPLPEDPSDLPIETAEATPLEAVADHVQSASDRAYYIELDSVVHEQSARAHAAPAPAAQKPAADVPEAPTIGNSASPELDKQSDATREAGDDAVTEALPQTADVDDHSELATGPAAAEADRIDPDAPGWRTENHEAEQADGQIVPPLALVRDQPPDDPMPIGHEAIGDGAGSEASAAIQPEVSMSVPMRSSTAEPDAAPAGEWRSSFFSALRALSDEMQTAAVPGHPPVAAMADPAAPATAHRSDQPTDPVPIEDQPATAELIAPLELMSETQPTRMSTSAVDPAVVDVTPQPPLVHMQEATPSDEPAADEPTTVLPVADTPQAEALRSVPEASPALNLETSTPDASPLEPSMPEPSLQAAGTVDTAPVVDDRKAPEDAAPPEAADASQTASAAFLATLAAPVFAARALAAKSAEAAASHPEAGPAEQAGDGDEKRDNPSGVREAEPQAPPAVREQHARPQAAGAAFFAALRELDLQKPSTPDGTEAPRVLKPGGARGGVTGGLFDSLKRNSPPDRLQQKPLRDLFQKL